MKVPRKKKVLRNLSRYKELSLGGKLSFVYFLFSSIESFMMKSLLVSLSDEMTFKADWKTANFYHKKANQNQ